MIFGGFYPTSCKFLNLSLHFTRCLNLLLMVGYLSCFEPFGFAVPHLLPPNERWLPNFVLFARLIT